MVKLILASLLLLMLTACGMHTVKQTKIQLLPTAPPDSLILDCPIDEPPSLTGFYELDVPIMVKAWISQTLNLGICNVDKQGLREWKENLKKISKDGGS